jgi:hypothetical protein
MGIKRSASSGYLKTNSESKNHKFRVFGNIQNQRTAAGSGYFKKPSQNCRVSRRPGKEEPTGFRAAILLLQSK